MLLGCSGWLLWCCLGALGGCCGVAVVLWVVAGVLLGFYESLMCCFGCCGVLGGCCGVARVLWEVAVVILGCSGRLLGCC